MSEIATRPRRGLDLEKAFAKWSDPDHYDELVRISGCSPPPTNIPDKAGAFQKAMDYSGKWHALEDAFLDKLREGVIFCTAIEDGADDRECIKPGLWDVLEISFDVWIVAGKYRRFEEPEFFDANSVPMNAEPLPDWLKQRLSGDGAALRFQHSADYRQVSFNAIKFGFGEKQANVVRLLHAASRTENPWRKGADVLEEAGSGLTKMVDLFRTQKDWRVLIDSTRSGSYRLRIDEYGNPASH